MPTATIDILGRENDFTVRQAFKTRAFWFLALGHATSLLIVGAVMTHLVLHVNGELGYSLVVAGLVVSFMTLMQIVGLVGTSFLGDRINKRSIVITCMMLHAIGMLLLSYAHNLWMVIGFAAFHGIAWGSRGPLMQAIRADYFGTSHFGSIMGWSSMIVMLGMAFGPVYAGYIADHTGSYQAAFTSLAGAALIGAIFFLLAKQPYRTK
jgi:MFS family permease